MIANIIFLICLLAGVGFFSFSVSKIIRNINLGKDEDLKDNPAERFRVMSLVALGQSKMFKRPIPAILHITLYLGFIIINIEIIEIIIDGIFGTHRIFYPALGEFYVFLIGGFEWLAILVIVACVIFLARRNILKLKRFRAREITRWPKTDADIILVTEIMLMVAFLTWNATDQVLQQRGIYPTVTASAFPISNNITSWFSGMSDSGVLFTERFAWWLHIIGILLFLNYIPFSKHFHIILAFPNTYFTRLKPKAKFYNMQSVTHEVKLMLDPSTVTEQPADEVPQEPERFGAKDIHDLSWKNLMDAYSCTECGRCTDVCPANQTGKLLSPRKIMMDTRDRMEEVGKGIDKNGKDFKDEKTLLHNYILPEEIWACTTCQACVEACPVNIDPLHIIVQIRRYMVMEENTAPSELNMMFTKVENNGAPWQFSPSDRFNWADDLTVEKLPE
ncbi:MAG: 4Fe-4S dicluster domain-containing protein [Bacteroidia bacterium]